MNIILFHKNILKFKGFLIFLKFYLINMGNIAIFYMGLYVNTLDALHSETFLLCNLTLQRVRSKMILSNRLKDFGSVVMVCRTFTDCENTSRDPENVFCS